MTNKKNYYFLFGLKPFETLYFEGNNIHFIFDHYRRMKRAFHLLRIPFEISYERFEKILKDFGENIRSPYGAIRVYCEDEYLFVEEREVKYNRKIFEKGLSITISKVIRSSHNVLNYIKTFNMGINLIEEERAKEKGFDTALFLNEKNFITEVSFGNIFFRKGKILYTPHILSGVLPGIMRRKVIEIAKKMGYEVRKTFLTLRNIKDMEEAFITTSIAGVFPIKNIEEIYFSSRDFCEKASSIDFLKRPWNR
ncbi:MAG: aminotransferase class IV [Dictyoglomus sp.]